MIHLEEVCDPGLKIRSDFMNVSIGIAIFLETWSIEIDHLLRM